MITDIINNIEDIIEDIKNVDYTDIIQELDLLRDVTNKIELNNLKTYLKVHPQEYLAAFCYMLTEEDKNGYYIEDDVIIFDEKNDTIIAETMETYNDFINALMNEAYFTDKESAIISDDNKPYAISLEIYNNMKKFVEREKFVSQNIREMKSSNKKRLKSYTTIKNIFNSIKNNDIYIPANKMPIDINPDNLYKFINIIMNKNSDLYKQLIIENKNIPDCNNNKIDKLIYDYNLKLNKDEKERLTCYGIYNKMVDILNIIDNTVFKNLKHNSFIVELLLMSSAEIISDLLRIPDLTIDFFLQNKEIFISNKTNDIGKYELFINNLKILKQNENDLDNIYKYGSEILLLNNELLTIYSNLFKRYGISLNDLLSKKNGLNIEEIFNENIFDKLDIFIETNCLCYIENNPRLINDTNLINRLMLNKNYKFDSIIDGNPNPILKDGINFPMNSSKMTSSLEYTIYKSFIAFKSLEIDEYIENSDIVKWLDDNFLVNDYQYIIGDIFISRNKVLRNLNYLYKNNIEINNDNIVEAIKNLSNIDIIDKENIELEISKYKPMVYKKSIG